MSRREACRRVRARRSAGGRDDRQSRYRRGRRAARPRARRAPGARAVGSRGRTAISARGGARSRSRCKRILRRVKVGIVVPYSWSFWGGVVEHAELQADALQRRGIETRTIMGNDPPGSFTRVLHPRLGRHGRPPPDVIPVGRSVIVPANGSLPNIVLSPTSVLRIRQALERERFDLLHLHEPMTPAICISTLALARVPLVATFHACGELGWMRIGKPLWGFLAERLDGRIAVSAQARA